MTIVYSTIAIHQLYRGISFKMIRTFIEHQIDGKLHIFTDNVTSYDNYREVPNVFIEHINLPRKRLPDFDLNIKYEMLQKSYNKFNPDYIVLTDCDMFFAKPIDNNWFNILSEGLSVPLGYPPIKIPPTDFQNTVISEKGIELAKDANHGYYTFREGCLLLKINKDFYKFTEEWGKMFHEIEDKKLTDVCQIFEINLACERSGYPLNNLIPNPLMDALMMEERNGAIGGALR